MPKAEQIQYVPFDIGYHSKQSKDVLSMLTPILEMCLDGTGFFVSGTHAADAVCYFCSCSLSCCTPHHAVHAATTLRAGR